MPHVMNAHFDVAYASSKNSQVDDADAPLANKPDGDELDEVW